MNKNVRTLLRKLPALLVAFAMCITLLPCYAAAFEGEEESPASAISKIEYLSGDVGRTFYKDFNDDQLVASGTRIKITYDNGKSRVESIDKTCKSDIREDGSTCYSCNDNVSKQMIYLFYDKATDSIKVRNEDNTYSSKLYDRKVSSISEMPVLENGKEIKIKSDVPVYYHVKVKKGEDFRVLTSLPDGEIILNEDDSLGTYTKDSYLKLYDVTGRLIDENDDYISGDFASCIDVSNSEYTDYIVEVLSYNWSEVLFTNLKALVNPPKITNITVRDDQKAYYTFYEGINDNFAFATGGRVTLTYGTGADAYTETVAIPTGLGRENAVNFHDKHGNVVYLSHSYSDNTVVAWLENDEKTTFTLFEPITVSATNAKDMKYDFVEHFESNTPKLYKLNVAKGDRVTIKVGKYTGNKTNIFNPNVKCELFDGNTEVYFGDEANDRDGEYYAFLAQKDTYYLLVTPDNWVRSEYPNQFPPALYDISMEKQTKKIKNVSADMPDLKYLSQSLDYIPDCRVVLEFTDGTKLTKTVHFLRFENEVESKYSMEGSSYFIVSGQSVIVSFDIDTSKGNAMELSVAYDNDNSDNYDEITKTIQLGTYKEDPTAATLSKFAYIPGTKFNSDANSNKILYISKEGNYLNTYNPGKADDISFYKYVQEKGVYTLDKYFAPNQVISVKAGDILIARNYERQNFQLALDLVDKDGNVIKQPTPTPAKPNNTIKGKTVVAKGITLKAISENAASVVSIDNKNKIKSLVVQDTVKIDGKVIPVTTIEASALSGAKKLTKVTIGKNITEIKSKAFKSCKKLKTVIIKSQKLKKVAKNAFKGCKKITIKVPKSKKKAYKKLFKKAKIGCKYKIK